MFEVLPLMLQQLQQVRGRRVCTSVFAVFVYVRTCR